jgi:hypothetical protein
MPPFGGSTFKFFLAPAALLFSVVGEVFGAMDFSSVGVRVWRAVERAATLQ